MATVNKYDASLVATVRSLTSKGVPPADMVDKKMVDVPVATVMAILRDAREHSWSKISSRNILQDEPEEVVETSSGEADERPHDFGEPEAEGNGRSAVAEAQAATVAEAIAAGAVPKKERRDILNARGKKPPNTTDNKAMNAARRRRRGGNPADMRRRLLMDQERKNPEFTYRWILDRPGRVAEKTKFDDWDIVTDLHVLEGEGGSVTAVAGTNHYNADKMILVRKPLAYHKEDARLKLKEVDVLEDQIRQGPAKDGQSFVDKLGPKEVIERLKNEGDTSNTYVPSGEKITIGKVSETP